MAIILGIDELVVEGGAERDKLPASPRRNAPWGLAVAECVVLRSGSARCVVQRCAVSAVPADSELIIKQIKGEYKVKSPELQPLRAKARARGERRGSAGRAAACCALCCELCLSTRAPESSARQHRRCAEHVCAGCLSEGRLCTLSELCANPTSSLPPKRASAQAVALCQRFRKLTLRHIRREKNAEVRLLCANRLSAPRQPQGEGDTGAPILTSSSRRLPGGWGPDTAGRRGCEPSHGHAAELQGPVRRALRRGRRHPHRGPLPCGFFVGGGLGGSRAAAAVVLRRAALRRHANGSWSACRREGGF